MNTKKKGDRGVGRAICAFTTHGWTVCIPVTDSQDFDLVIDIPDEGWKRVQVKYIEAKARSGAYTAQLGVRGGTKGGIWKKPSEMNFDYLFVAAGDGTDWFVPRDKIRSAISLGIKTKNRHYLFKGSA